jgi:hypothetical protein
MGSLGLRRRKSDGDREGAPKSDLVEMIKSMCGVD